MLLYGFDREIALWVGKRTGVDDFGPCRAIGIVSHETIIAGVVYSNYRDGCGIEATIAADDPRWCSRGHLRGIFSYPWQQLRVTRITCLVPEGNARSLKLCKGLGFKVEGRHPGLFPGGVTGISLGMLRADCKWLDDRRP